MPTGWTFDGALWRNQGVLADPHAIERRGALAVDLSTLSTVIFPWSDGTAAKLRHTPILPDGTVVGTAEELDYGWRFPCTGPLSRIEIVDLKLTNQLTYLAEFGAEGLKTIWWMPTARIKDDGAGWWRPKRSAITGPGPFAAYEQPVEVDADEMRPDFAKGSIAYYGSEERRGVVLRPDGSIKKAYHTGKIWHSPRPTALFWSVTGALLGVVYGRLEWDAINAHEVKAYPLAECMAWVAAGAVEVSIDATLGYTTQGASSTPGKSLWAGPHTATENGVVSTYSACFYSQNSANAYVAMYANSATNTPGSQPLIANSRSANLLVNSLGWKTFSATGAPAVVLGSKYHFMMSYTLSTNLNIYHDVVAGFNVWTKVGVYYPNPQDPAPSDAEFASYSNRELSIYATLVSSGQPARRRFGVKPHGISGVTIY